MRKKLFSIAFQVIGKSLTQSRGVAEISDRSGRHLVDASRSAWARHGWITPAGFTSLAQGGSPENRDAQTFLPRMGYSCCLILPKKPSGLRLPLRGVSFGRTVSQGFRPELITKDSSGARLLAKGDYKWRRSWARQSSGALLCRIPKSRDSGYGFCLKAVL